MLRFPLPIILLAALRLGADEAPLDTIEVIAAQPPADIAGRTVTISPEAVALHQPRTAADLLGLADGVFIQNSQQGGGSPMIRGFAANRLLYTVDGVRMNTAIYRGGNLQNVICLDPFAIDRTTVAFGAGAEGSDAIGGVMRFETLTPQLSEAVHGHADARYASANAEQTGHLDVNVGDGKHAMLTSITFNEFDHLRQGSDGPDHYLKPYYVARVDGSDVVVTQDDPLLQIPSAYSQVHLMQKFRYVPAPGWDLRYGFHYSETSPYGRYDRHNRTTDTEPRYGEWDYGPQKWMMNHLSAAYEGAHTFFDAVQLDAAHQRDEESRISRNFGDTRRRTQTETVDAWSLNLNASKTLGERHTLHYGGEYVRNDVDSVGTYTDIMTALQSPGPSRYPVATWQSFALYLDDRFDLNEALTLQGGARYNRVTLDATFDTTFYPFPFTDAHLTNDALTGNLGIIYRVSPTLGLSLETSTAFRAPNVDDMGKVFDSEPGKVTVPNPDLRPEYAYSADLGIAVHHGDLHLDLHGFYTLLDDAMVRRDFTLDGQETILYDGELSQVQAIQNGAEVRVYGLQSSVSLALTERFSLGSELSYQVGRETLADGSTGPARHAAPLHGVTRLAYTQAKMQLELNTRYQAERRAAAMPEEEKGKTEIYALDGDGNAYAPAWYTVNVRSSVRVSERLDVRAGIENLTDQRYRPYGSGISGAGCNVVFALSLRM